MKKRGPSSTQPRPTKPRWLWPAAIAAVVAAAAVTFWTTTNLNNKTKPAVFNGEGQSALADKKTPQTPNTLPPQEIKNQNSKIENQTPPPPPTAYQPRNIEPAPNIPAPGPITLAPSQLTIGSHADANPLDFAFHPSRFADPSHVANRIGIVTLDLDPEPATNVAQPPPAVTPYAKAVELERARAFAMSLTLDLQNNLWVGTEDGGVQKYDPTKPPLEAWTQFTTKDGLGDNNGYAIATDHQGRIWVGHLNHGVSVYNGQKWQTYETVAGLSHPGTLAGPLGERIFSIEVAPNNWPLTTDNSPTFKDPLTEKLIPLSGSVWMCSSAGLAVYAPTTDSWHYFTRADGLPSDQANALAFAPDGTLYLATQCDGIAIASPSDHYASWKQIKGPDELPTTPTGTGLPTNLMNDILVAKDGTVYAATTAGLAFSKDKGQNWQFIRGKDYADKVRGRVGGAPADWAPIGGAILSEDYCTALAQDGEGNIHIGHRATVGEVISPSTLSLVNGTATEYVTELRLVSASKVVLRTTYSNGIAVNVGNSGNPLTKTKAEPLASRLPSSAKLADSELESLLKRMEAIASNTKRGSAAFLMDDWATQGDWVGRYGRRFAVLYAMKSPFDDPFPGLNRQYLITEYIGPNKRDGDAIRRWLPSAWAKTNDQRALYSPRLGIRRQATLDDHGEAYPMTVAGPDIWLKVQVPEGRQRLSLYFFNENGHVGVNRYRDLLIDVKEYSPNLVEADASPSLATSRVNQFFGGVYKQLLLNGPARYNVIIRRNGLNATLCAAFLDQAVEDPGDPTVRFLAMGKVRLDPPPRPDLNNGPPFLKIAGQIWNKSEALRKEGDPSWISVQILAYRAGQSLAPSTNVENWRWHLNLINGHDRSNFKVAMDQAWEGYITMQPPGSKAAATLRRVQR